MVMGWFIQMILLVGLIVSTRVDFPLLRLYLNGCIGSD